MRENRLDQIVRPSESRNPRAQAHRVRAALLTLLGLFLVMASGTSSVKAAVAIEPDAPVLPAVVPIDDSETPFKVWLPAVSANDAASRVYIEPTDEDPTRQAATVELCLSSVETGQNIRGNWPGASNQQSHLARKMLRQLDPGRDQRLGRVRAKLLPARGRTVKG